MSPCCPSPSLAIEGRSGATWPGVLCGQSRTGLSGGVRPPARRRRGLRLVLHRCRLRRSTTATWSNTALGRGFRRSGHRQRKHGATATRTRSCAIMTWSSTWRRPGWWTRCARMTVRWSPTAARPGGHSRRQARQRGWGGAACVCGAGLHGHGRTSFELPQRTLASTEGGARSYRLPDGGHKPQDGH